MKSIDPTLLEIIIYVLLGLGAFFGVYVFNTLNALRNEVAELKLMLVGGYVHRDTHAATMSTIFGRIDKISDDLRTGLREMDHAKQDKSR